MALQIDPRHTPMRGLLAIDAHYGDGGGIELRRRQIRSGLIDVSYDGTIIITTPFRLDNSPLITGATVFARTRIRYRRGS
jgi:hypothetical protein